MGFCSTVKPIYYVLVDTTFGVNTTGSTRCVIVGSCRRHCASARDHQHSLSESCSGDWAAVIIMLVVGGAVIVRCWGAVVVGHHSSRAGGK